MQSQENPHTPAPWEDELHGLLDVREAEQELERKRLGRKLVFILGIAAIILIGLIFCFPPTRKAAGSPARNPTAAVSPIKNEDLRFGMELFQFVQPAARTTSSKAPNQP